MPVHITVESDDAERTLAKAVHIMTDLRNFWPLVVPLFIKWMGRQFATEGGYASGGWAHLSPDYAAWKAVAYPGKGILQATGKLRRAASEPSRTVTPNSLVLTIHSDYLKYHQDGTSNMPARPLIFDGDRMPANARNELEQAAVDYVTKALKAL